VHGTRCGPKRSGPWRAPWDGTVAAGHEFAIADRLPGEWKVEHLSFGAPASVRRNL